MNFNFFPTFLGVIWMSKMIDEIVVGTGNAGKLREFQDLFRDEDWRITGLGDFPPIPEPEENGETFEENATIKARCYALALNRYVIADDSGLCVDHIGGKPGVYSARFAGKNASDEENMKKLLVELAGVPSHERTASFVATLVVSDPEGNIVAKANGVCPGRISAKPFGINGFGYDPIFVPDGYDDSFGLLDISTKRKLSHRASAARKIRGLVRNISKKST